MTGIRFREKYSVSIIVIVFLFWMFVNACHSFGWLK